MSRVYDTVIFFNEFDVLDLRLNTLKDVVDEFVIVETPETFSGKPNPFFNPSRWWMPPWDQFNIRHHVARLPPVEDGQTPPWGGRWPREYAMRNAIADALRPIARPDDYILLSDADEIPDPRAVASRHMGTFVLKLYVYALNAYFDQPWWGTVGTEYRQLVFVTPQSLRGQNAHWPRLYNGGWHFSYIGGEAQMRAKVEAGGDVTFATEEYLSQLQARADKLEDPMGRPFPDGLKPGRVVPLDQNFPPYLVENQERFAPFLRAVP